MRLLVFMYKWFRICKLVCVCCCTAICLCYHLPVFLLVFVSVLRNLFCLPMLLLSHMSFLLIYLWVCTLKCLICCMCCARPLQDRITILINNVAKEVNAAVCAWVVMCMFTYACLLECPCVRMSVCLRFFNIFSMCACMPACLCMFECLDAVLYTLECFCDCALASFSTSRFSSL